MPAERVYGRAPVLLPSIGEEGVRELVVQGRKDLEGELVVQGRGDVGAGWMCKGRGDLEGELVVQGARGPRGRASCATD